MRPAGTSAHFLESPVGHWVAGKSYLVWSWNLRLRGALVWGRPTEGEFKRMWSLVDVFHDKAPSADVVTDTSRVESVDATAYAALLEGMRARVGVFASKVGLHALVRSDGLLGALAEGFLPLAGAKHQWRVFSSSIPAFDWLDHPAGAAACLEVERLANEAQHLAPEVRQVRDYLKAHLTDATLPRTAQALGLSERSLHRTLKDHRTRFRDELAQARIDAARHLLGGTDDKIETIARRVGCASHAHLTTLFQRQTGQRPTEYRAQVQTSHVGLVAGSPPGRRRR